MLENEKGSTFMLVIIGFFVIFIFTMSLIFIGNSNSRNANVEENGSKAYYVAKTGAESLINSISKKDDIKAELDDLIIKTNEGKYGTGEFGEGEFEIQVSEKINDDGTITYKITSKGTVNKTDRQIIAVINPNYKTSGWGDGQVFIDGSLSIPFIPQMAGAGLKLYTTEKKDGKEESPIKFVQGGAMDLFIQDSSRWPLLAKQKGKTKETLENEGITLDYQISKIIDEKGKNIGDYSLITKERDKEFIKKEVLKNKFGGKSIELNYGYDSTKDQRFKEPVFPSEKEAVVSKINNGEIDASGSGGNLLIKQDVIEIKKNQTLTIKTNKNREINIITDVLTVLDNAKIDVEGDGVVNFYVTGSVHCVSKSRMGIKEGINFEPKINIYLKEGATLNANNGAHLINVDTIGVGATVDFQDNVVYEGVIITKDIGLTDECTIKSPTTGTSSVDVNNIKSFKKIIWEK